MPDKMEKVEITAAADGYDARREDTASKIVVGHEEIVKYGDTSVLDVLKRLPGVTVSRRVRARRNPHARPGQRLHAGAGQRRTC
ncbi:Plug domain-containing protein [Massilia sp. H-1]|nr:Plug domain-containing protein [Massilia sp. H-1]